MPVNSEPELPCPRCGYNVVTQILGQCGRCPECGSALPSLAAEPRTSLAKRWMVLQPRPKRFGGVAFWLVLSAVAPITLESAMLILNGLLLDKGGPAIDGLLIVMLAIALGACCILLMPMGLAARIGISFLYAPIAFFLLFFWMMFFCGVILGEPF
jgi:hypothetical protein